jgi:hypothetical protein
MGGKRVFIYVLVVVFTICALLLGVYFYITLSSKKVSNTSDNSTQTATQPVTLAVMADVMNGSGGSMIAGCTTGASCYPRTLGGVDDYNAGGTRPDDTYFKLWTVCSPTNNFCGTSDSNAEKQDPITGLVWSRQVGVLGNWFMANNCKYPNGLPGDDGVCDTVGEAACICVKNVDDRKTGCEASGVGGWRLPHQKEFMQAYIDGSYMNLSDVNVNFWTSTTSSTNTEAAWVFNPATGNGGRFVKTIADYAVRCVR